jgi:hypothetical protein
MAKRDDIVIPLQTFIGAGKGHWDRTRLNFAGVECLLPIVTVELGLSGWQLMRLLGSDWPSTHLRQWTIGKTSMGSLYLGRLVYLYHLKTRGFDLCYLKKIDWVEGKAYWRKKKGEEEPKEALEAQKTPSFGPNSPKVIYSGLERLRIPIDKDTSLGT